MARQKEAYLTRCMAFLLLSGTAQAAPLLIASPNNTAVNTGAVGGRLDTNPISIKKQCGFSLKLNALSHKTYNLKLNPKGILYTVKEIVGSTCNGATVASFVHKNGAVAWGSPMLKPATTYCVVMRHPQTGSPGATSPEYLFKTPATCDKKIDDE